MRNGSEGSNIEEGSDNEKLIESYRAEAEAARQKIWEQRKTEADFIINQQRTKIGRIRGKRMSASEKEKAIEELEQETTRAIRDIAPTTERLLAEVEQLLDDRIFRVTGIRPSEAKEAKEQPESGGESVNEMLREYEEKIKRRGETEDQDDKIESDLDERERKAGFGSPEPKDE